MDPVESTVQFPVDVLNSLQGLFLGIYFVTSYFINVNLWRSSFRPLRDHQLENGCVYVSVWYIAAFSALSVFFCL